MANPFEIPFKIVLHLNGNPVLQKILFLCNEFWGKVPNALLGIGTVGGTAKVHTGVQKTVAALLASTGSIIFKKLYLITTVRAFYLIDGSWLPVATVLSRAFHCVVSFCLVIFPQPVAQTACPDRMNRIYMISIFLT
jgi:hypothetical protein